MARVTVKTVDGWPVMEPLGEKEADLLRRSMAPGERVLGQVIGSQGQAVVATDRKVLVVKTAATSFDYRNLVGVEVTTGWAIGEFAIADIKEVPDGLVFNKQDARHFDAMAAKIREMTGATLADLHAVGILTDDEFAAKKAELLARIQLVP
jgi:Short C-terminal domain